MAVEVLHLILSSTLENLESIQKAKRRELGIPANRDANQISNELPLLGEGGESGSIEPGKSVAFATLEVCLCILVRVYLQFDFSFECNGAFKSFFSAFQSCSSILKPV